MYQSLKKMPKMSELILWCTTANFAKKKSSPLKHLIYRQGPFSLPWSCYPTEYSNLDHRKSKHIDGDSITL